MSLRNIKMDPYVLKSQAKIVQDNVLVMNGIKWINFSIPGLKGVRIGIADNLKSKIDEAVSKHEEKYIKNQSEVYKQWNAKREADLEAQKLTFEKEAQLQHIEQTKLEMDEKEKKLFFFDNYQDMEREKRAKYLAWTKTFPKKTGSLWGTQIKMGKRDPNEPIVSRREKLAAKAKK